MSGKLNMNLGGIEIQPTLGLYGATLLGATAKYNSDYVEDQDLKAYLNSTDFGVIVGGDMILAKNLLAGMKIEAGMVNVWKENSALHINPSLKNLCVRFSVGYVLRDLKL